MSTHTLSDVVELAQALVRIPSLNPMHRDYLEAPYLESRVTDYLESQFERLGLPWERHQVLPGRDNILARVERGGSRLILLEVHQDTVPVEGMTIDPFAAEVRDGRLYGRGSCDVKGGMASMLHTVARLAAEAEKTGADVVLACTVNEENGFDGARHLRSLWETGGSQLLTSAPDMIIVAEPTRLDVVTAHKGAVRWRCSTTGRATHSSTPEKGQNAIYRMGRVAQHLESYSARLGQSAEHPLVGRPSLSVGIIEGGISVNTVPDRCTITIDRRLLPDESGDAAMADVVDHLRQQLPGITLEHDPPFLCMPGLSDRFNGELADSLSQVIQQHGQAGGIVGVPFGTDASTLAGPDSPTVVFGPGDIAQAHTVDEWVSLEQLHAAAAILYDFCRSIAPG